MLQRRLPNQTTKNAQEQGAFADEAFQKGMSCVRHSFLQHVKHVLFRKVRKCRVVSMATCKYCRKVIPLGASFCSFACKIAFRKEKVRCRNCGEYFISRRNEVFCSYACRKEFKERSRFSRRVHDQGSKSAGVRL